MVTGGLHGIEMRYSSEFDMSEHAKHGQVFRPRSGVPQRTHGILVVRAGSGASSPSALARLEADLSPGSTKVCARASASHA